MAVASASAILHARGTVAPRRVSSDYFPPLPSAQVGFVTPSWVAVDHRRCLPIRLAYGCATSPVPSVPLFHSFTHPYTFTLIHACDRSVLITLIMRVYTPGGHARGRWRVIFSLFYLSNSVDGGGKRATRVLRFRPKPSWVWGDRVGFGATQFSALPTLSRYIVVTQTPKELCAQITYFGTKVAGNRKLGCYLPDVLRGD